MRGHRRPHPGQRGLLGCPDRLRPAFAQQAPQAQQADEGPVREGRGDATPVHRRDSHPGRSPLHARAGADRGTVRGRPARRRDRQVQGQGLRGRDEAARLQGPVRLARHPAQAPLARLHRRLRHPGPGVQGPADGRPDGRRARHHPQPDRARGGHRARPAAHQGGCPWPQGRPDPGPQRRPGAADRREGGLVSVTVSVVSPSGRAGQDVELPDEIFSAPVNVPLIHQVVVAQEAAARQGTHATKTRGLVRGGGKKPYRQKGTGRARQGSLRAPQYAGGGTVHGPQPRSYVQRTPKKMKAAALRGALSDRAASGRIAVVSGFVEGDSPRTRDAMAVLRTAIGLLDARPSSRVLVVAEAEDERTWKSLRNAPGARLLATGQLNTYDVLASEHIVFTEAALSAFTGQPIAPSTDQAAAPKRRASKPKAGAAPKSGSADADAAQPAEGAEPAAEPKAPRRRTTPKEGDEQ